MDTEAKVKLVKVFFKKKKEDKKLHEPFTSIESLFQEMIIKGVHALGRRVATQVKSLHPTRSAKGTLRSLMHIFFERCVLLAFCVELHYRYLAHSSEMLRLRARRHLIALHRSVRSVWCVLYRCWMPTPKEPPASLCFHRRRWPCRH